MQEIEIRRLLKQFHTTRDHGSFRQLYGLFEKRIWASILSRNVPHEAAGDVFQEVCLGLARSLSNHQTQVESLTALVYSITKHKVADYFRRGNEHTYSLDHMLEGSFDLPAPGNHGPALENKDAFEKVMRAAGVNPDQRQALVLHYLLGYTQKEIAQITQVPEETVKSRIFHGKKAIQRNMTREEVGA